MKIVKITFPDIFLLEVKPIKSDISKAHKSVDEMIKVKNEKENKETK